jgi:hypothetical protein
MLSTPFKPTVDAKERKSANARQLVCSAKFFLNTRLFSLMFSGKPRKNYCCNSAVPPIWKTFQSIPLSELLSALSRQRLRQEKVGELSRAAKLSFGVTFCLDSASFGFIQPPRDVIQTLF